MAVYHYPTIFYLVCHGQDLADSIFLADISKKADSAALVGDYRLYRNMDHIFLHSWLLPMSACK